MSRIYGEGFMNHGVLRDRCRKFKDGQIDVHDGSGEGLKSVSCEDHVQGVGQVVRERNRDDFRLFRELKTGLPGQPFCTTEEPLETAVGTYLNTLAATF
ncbi:hypothetical protein AVEN_214781-1 [Araneus ventricosus]|uniref:Uncharacterized protein n=1 Tax=Araneus ventricosus TaxID=182803 RepID=A0A4Y2HD66_ARAVE|nr:hypothetical protein AVEN_137569-1 [Araneus ventricosus]GBM63260.1 hypothetical protein AVEN_214781-1 [Araneus ventricosus]